MNRGMPEDLAWAVQDSFVMGDPRTILSQDNPPMKLQSRQQLLAIMSLHVLLSNDNTRNVDGAQLCEWHCHCV